LRQTLSFLALAGAFFGLPALSMGVEAAAEPKTAPCAECGMTAEVDGRFSARLVAGGTASYFCDIGDMVAYIARVRPKDYVAAVRDFPSGEWLDASTAFFVIDKKAYATPMGWGVAAFRDAAAAGVKVLDFETLRKALR
jgi:nitrous oxide reductase accessory protein NosL